MPVFDCYSASGTSMHFSGGHKLMYVVIYRRQTQQTTKFSFAHSLSTLNDTSYSSSIIHHIHH